MTNKDKYLKEGISGKDIFNLSQALGEYLTIKCRAKNVFVSDINTFFALKLETIPTLTEDERVILSNIEGHPRYISRQKGHGLMAYDSAKRVGKTGWSYDNGRAMYSFSHLFQFIKERRRI